MAADPAVDTLGELDRAVLEPFRLAWSETDRIWEEMEEALTSVAQEHRAVMESAGLASDLAEADGSEALASYRREAALRVHAPFVETLRRVDPVRRIAEVGDRAEDEAWTQAAALDDAVTLPWDDAGLVSREPDRMGRRLGLALVRGMRRMRSSASRPGVPLRALACRVIVREATPRNRRAFREAQRSYARWVGALEQAWDAWADHLLRPVEPAGPAGAGADDDQSAGAGRTAEAVAAVRALQRALEDAVRSRPDEEAATRGRDAVAHCAGVLARELPLAGTAALSLGSGHAAAQPARREGSGPTWVEWYGHALDRFALHGALLDVVLGCESAVARFEERIAEQGGDLRPRCARGAEGLRRLASRFDHGLEGGLSATLVQVRPEAEKCVAEALAALPDPGRFRGVLESSADALSESIHALAQVVPSELELHELPEAGDALHKPDDARTVRLGEIARRTFDVLRMEKIRTSPFPLAERVAEVVGTGEGIRDVFAFGLDSAQGELDAGEEGARERALTLAREGLGRAADALDSLPAEVDRAVKETRLTVEAAAARGWGRLVDRGLSEGVQSQLLDARSTLIRKVAELQERWAPFLRRTWLRARAEGRRLRAVLSKLLRRGKKLVGSSGSAPASYRAGKVLAEADQFYRTLPLVYQRLYSLNPVADRALLVGREAILAEIEQRVVAWRHEDGIPLVLYARPGVGISSLFLVLMERVEELGTRAVHHTLERRYRDEAEFAAHLATLMGLPPVDSLDALAAAILGADKGEVPDLVALEELEHLYLRSPGGTDLVERLLTLMSETEPRVFWLASTTESAWQLVRKAEPTAVSQVEDMALPPLDAEQVQLAILARHRRSGVPLGFQEPLEGRHLLRRRLRRIKGEEGRRQVLERDFFSKLHQASGGNIGLALYHWLRAVDFDAVPGELRVRPVESVDFSFLDGLDLTQNFTLKALLEHRTLTLEEHDAVFRLPRKESFQIMESLLNRYLVEPVRDADGSDDLAVAEHDERRYRIVPLLAAAVASHLAARNIVH